MTTTKDITLTRETPTIFPVTVYLVGRGVTKVGEATSPKHVEQLVRMVTRDGDTPVMDLPWYVDLLGNVLVFEDEG